MSRSLFFVVATSLGVAAPAQVPFAYIVTAENGSNTSAGMRFVEPNTGVVTDVRPAPGARVALPRALTVGLDPATPASIPFVSGLSTSIAPVFLRAAVQDNQLTALTNHAMQTATGIPNRLEVSTFGILAAIGTGNLPGLWLAPAFGGAATLLAPLAGASDVAVNGNDAFVSSYAAGRPTQIEQVDLTTGLPRTVGSNYPSLRAILAPAGGGVWAGTDAGDLLIIDPVTGTIVSQTNLFAVPILALAADPSGRVYALTDQSEVFDVASTTAPVYRSTQRVNDIAVGVVDLASFLVFGTGCGQSGTVPMYQAAAGEPSSGNANFAVALVGGRPLVPALFAIGSSRTAYGGVPLPLPLDFLRMPGCTLYSDLGLTLPLSLDANGAATLPLPIPPGVRLIGRHFTTQWFAIDLVANPAGVVASDGGEGIIR